MKFEDYYSLLPELKDNLVRSGFKKPTDIQYKAIPSILKGEDVLAIAQTGTGKTAAFVIPVLNRIAGMKSSGRPGGIRCLVMVPTRELARQVTEVFDKLGKNTGIRALCLFGGVEQAPQIARLEKGADVLVTTPGRMFDLASQGFVRLNRVEILILDEADRMLDPAFIKDIRDVTRFLAPGRQTLFFSATIDESIKKLAYSLVHNPIRIQISPKDPVSKNVSHGVAFVEADDKRFFLERIVRQDPERKILVFVRTKVRAERVLKAMERVGIASLSIHGDKDQKERFTALSHFKSGTTKLMVATDVSARGIDIPEVDIVVNYDLPDHPENYVHRVGRTGRGVRKGEAVSFCSADEKPMLEAIEKLITKPVQRIDLSREDYRETLEASVDFKTDLKALLEEAEALGKRKKRKK